MGNKEGGCAEQGSWTVPFQRGICWVPASYFPHECVAQQHMSHTVRHGKLSSSTCWTRYFANLKSMSHLTPDWQSGICKPEPQPGFFNTGFLNSCTLRVSVLPEMEPPVRSGMQSRKQQPQVSERKWLVIYFCHRPGSSSWLLCPAVPGANREGEAGKKTWGWRETRGK